jgi:hypothetical protein
MLVGVADGFIEARAGGEAAAEDHLGLMDVDGG